MPDIIFNYTLFKVAILIGISYLPLILLKETRKLRVLALFWSIISLNQVVSVINSDSIIIGQSISILFLSVSLVLLLKMHGLLELEGNGLFSVALMGLLLSMILVCPLTLRESYEIFFFMFSIYCFIGHFKTGDKVLFVCLSQ